MRRLTSAAAEWGAIGVLGHCDRASLKCSARCGRDPGGGVDLHVQLPLAEALAGGVQDLLRAAAQNFRPLEHAAPDRRPMALIGRFIAPATARRWSAYAIKAPSTAALRAEVETMLQVHSVGPWGITYVDPADDPAQEVESLYAVPAND